MEVIDGEGELTKLLSFEAKVLSGDKTESKYWMPSLYKNNTLELLINMLIPKLSGSFEMGGNPHYLFLR